MSICRYGEQRYGASIGLRLCFLKVKAMGGIRGSSIVEVVMADGTTYRKFVKYARGQANNPLSEEELRQKFDYCLERAPLPLPRKSINKLVPMIDHMEKVEDVSEIVELLVPG